MIEPNSEIVSKVAVDLVTSVFKSSLGRLKEAQDWLNNKNTQFDPLGSAARKYAERIEERYNSMRIFGMDKPVPLRSIYTRVNILEKITSRHRATVRELELFFDRDFKNFGRIQK